MQGIYVVWSICMISERARRIFLTSVSVKESTKNLKLKLAASYLPKRNTKKMN